METINFLEPKVAQTDIEEFAQEKVNLKQDRAKAYRDKVYILRGHLERYISEHPDVGLVKMLLSGSLRKHTALRTINDIDVAIYVKGGTAPSELGPLLTWLEERLKKTYHQMPEASIRIDGPCVVISYSGLGIDIDVAPIYYEGDTDWKGYLWDRQTGQRILTSIPQHIEFVKKRRVSQPKHYAQIIRLLKWWARQRSQDSEPLKMRSFAIELLVSKILDNGAKLGNYADGLEAFFGYITRTKLKERIAFSDFYPLSKLPTGSNGVVEFFDPVNPENNVTSDMTEPERILLVKRAEEALDALAYAKTCTTKCDAIECWQDLMGSSFNP